MSKVKYTLIVFCICLLAGGCKNSEEGVAIKQEEKNMNSKQAGLPAVVYKTRQDYSDKVAVMLSEDRQQVIAYPDPKDIAGAGEVRDCSFGRRLFAG